PPDRADLGGRRRAGYLDLLRHGVTLTAAWDEVDRPQHLSGNACADVAGGQVLRDDRVRADDAALADRDAARHDDVRAEPAVVADPRRPLRREALPGDRPVRVVEAVLGVGDEAAVREH